MALTARALAHPDRATGLLLFRPELEVLWRTFVALRKQMDDAHGGER